MPATPKMEQKAAPTGKQAARQEARALPVPQGQIASACWVECQAHLQPCHSCAQRRVRRQTGMRTNELALQVFTGNFSRRTRSMRENLNPRATHQIRPEDPVGSAGSLPQEAAALQSTAQHSPKAG